MGVSIKDAGNIAQIEKLGRMQAAGQIGRRIIGVDIERLIALASRAIGAITGM